MREDLEARIEATIEPGVEWQCTFIRTGQMYLVGIIIDREPLRAPDGRVVVVGDSPAEAWALANAVFDRWLERRDRRARMKVVK